MMILFVSACSNGETEQSEADTQEEAIETQEETDDGDELTELEKENEELRKELAEKEKAEAEESAAEGTNNESAEETEVESEQDAESVKEDTIKVAAKEFTIEERQEMNELFYDWAVERAEIGKMAVTKIYFSHGAAGHGDWYANTPDGEVQAQNQDNPGFDHFDIHGIGGVAFYHPVSENFGIDEHAHVPGVGEGYSRLAKPETNIHKYMLADNGVVYELIAKIENTALSSGFGEYADDGTRGDFTPNIDFEVSGDQDAQQEWQRILGMYQ